MPLGDRDPAQLLAELKQRGVVAAARDGNLRLSVHFYNHEDDIQQVATALADIRAPESSEARRGPSGPPSAARQERETWA